MKSKNIVVLGMFLLLITASAVNIRGVRMRTEVIIAGQTVKNGDLSTGLEEIEVTFILLDNGVDSYFHLVPVPKIKT